ncbi:MAG TPA: MBL fold metallo-hydrolase [Solirubrobacteraceae bacterium]|nr:MBL fold metallo-hydrolase [Solirubrobacteraceae bacterium]
MIVVTSQLFQAHCTLVRGPGTGGSSTGGSTSTQAPAGALSVSEWRPGGGASGEEHSEGNGGGASEEAFAIDSPVLPEELELLPALVEQAGFPTPQGLLATHADFDHVLAPLAFPEATLGCAESSAERLNAEPGAAQRELRRFDEELQIERRPLSLGAVQPLAVPGRCSIGAAELELHAATGHTSDGMAVWIGWARVLVAGDYLSPIELPSLGEGKGMLDAYLATLERLQPLVANAEHVVPGHGPLIDGERALAVLEQDRAYLAALRERGADAELPEGRRAKVQRELHAKNVARL